jgi:SecD/SecF fusion protein
VLALVTGFTVVTVTPPEKKIRLGLDLKGGTSFTVQIDQDRLRSQIMAQDPSLKPDEVERKFQDTMRDADQRATEVLRNRVDTLGVNEPLIALGKNHRILIQLPGADAEQREAAEKSIKSAAFLEFRLVHKDNARLVDTLWKSGRAPEGYTVMDSGERKYFQRTREFERLTRDPEYAKRVATFEQPDPNYVFLLERTTLKDGREVFSPCFVRKRSEMTGETLKRAEVERDTMSGQIHVALSFKAKGANEFAHITTKYAPHGPLNKDSDVGRQLAIILDGQLYSAPVIKEPIPNGKAIISGDFSYAEGALLRNILNAGSLPAPVQIMEKRMVDSTLGADSIRSGVRASLFAALVVAVFMLIYYSFCGLLADLALLMNLVLLPAGMILSGGLLAVFVRDSGISRSVIQLPVLTMPGIAGIVLTIGMAVDANVLIFERMREEFRTGKSVRAAVDAGYKRAFLAIFDSNLTTILTAVILFIFGSGPIRGFAVTLTAGIIVSMYTALTVTRMIFDATVKDTDMQPYRMLQLIGETKIDFLAKARPAILFSAAVILLTIGYFGYQAATRPERVFGVDLRGGTSVTLNFQNGRAPIENVREALGAAGVTDAEVQYQAEMDGSGDVLQIRSGLSSVDGRAVGAAVEGALQKALPQKSFRMIGEEDIGPQVGRDLRKDAVIALILSWVAMIVYITLRFEFGFSLGAIVALIHDVLVSLGIYCLLGRQVSLTIVAALLTIIGYSVNDTIVVFDRIRENMRQDQRTSFRDLCNLAVNQTLSRTILTSLTVLFCVLVLFVFGGGAINDFALCMLIGLFAGTYSTVFIATPVMLAWYRNRRPGSAVQK